MNKSSIYILMGSIIILVIIILFSSFTSSSKPEQENDTTQSSHSDQNLSLQESDENNVVIVVKPKVISEGKKTQFEIQLNTHSVNLDFDLEKISKLIDENGNEYTDSTWEGSPPGGHHRNGVLTFDTPMVQTKTLRLIMIDESSIKERTFEWKI